MDLKPENQGHYKKQKSQNLAPNNDISNSGRWADSKGLLSLSNTTKS